MRCRFSLLLLFLLISACSLTFAADHAITPVPGHAAFRVAAVQVRVAPDHRDWNYQLGEPARFSVTLTADNEPLDGVTVSYQVGPDMFPGAEQRAVVPAAGLVIDGGTLRVPGFLRCSVRVEMAGQTYRGVATAAFAPEKIVPTQTEPGDFDAFWSAGKADLAKIPIEPRLTLLPEASTAALNVYHVNFRTVGPTWTAAPARIYGILCEPKAPGRYPAILRVPGAGVRPYGGDKDIAARGAITLEIGIHGVPVNMPHDVYDQLYAGALAYYWTFNSDDRTEFYYRRVYLSCLRANDFLTSRESWNGRDLLVSGASQGGQLAIATAALDSRVTGLTATHPAFCDVTGPLHGRAGGWPHPFQPDATTRAPSRHATPAKIATSAYYDTVNFARRLKVPGFYIWGYNDEVTPPTSVYAAYNVITAPKQLALALEQGHTYPPEQYRAIRDWIVRHLNLP